MEIITNVIVPTTYMNRDTYMNKDLAKATTKVNKLGTSIQRNLFEVAAIIAEVDRTQCYEEDGFKNVHEWTAQAFGIKKTASYTFLKIGKDYVEITLNENGKAISYGSNLYHATSRDFSISQVEALLPAGKDLAEDLAATERVIPEMTVREIKKIVKELTADPEDVTEAETDEPEEEVVEQEEVVSKEKAYYDACVAAEVLWDYVETKTEKDALAVAIQALENLGKHLFGEQVTI